MKKNTTNHIYTEWRHNESHSVINGEQLELTEGLGFHQRVLAVVSLWPRLKPPQKCRPACSRHRWKKQNPINTRTIAATRHRLPLKCRSTCSCPGSTWGCRTSSLCTPARDGRWTPSRSPGAPAAAAESAGARSCEWCPDKLSASLHPWNGRRQKAEELRGKGKSLRSKVPDTKPVEGAV